MTTVFITGGHAGLGLESVRQIAATGKHDLVLAGRDFSAVECAAAEVRRSYNVNARALLLDASSLASVRSAAASFRQMIADGDVAPLGTLMLNAGAQFLGTAEYSADGYELTFATNCLGHFLLVNLLADDIEQGGRIVFTASGTHDPATMDGKMVGKAVVPDALVLADRGKDGKPISGGQRYTTSKLCTIMYAYELDRRLMAAGADVASIAFDPGLIVDTGLIRSAPPLAQRLMRTGFAKWVFRMLGVTMGSIPFSGGALAAIATSPRFADATGKYMQSHNGRLIEARSSAISYDQQAARKLWEDSTKLVHLTPADQSKGLAI